MRGGGLAPGWVAGLVARLVDVGVGFHSCGRPKAQAPEGHARRVMGVATTKLDYGRIVGRELGIPVVEAATPVLGGRAVLLSLAAVIDHVVPLAFQHKRKDRTLLSFDLVH